MTPSANTASPTTPPVPRSYAARRHRNDAPGPRRRPPGSSRTATRPTPRWPACSSRSSAPACARAKPSDCTGTTSTWARAFSTRAAPSRPGRAAAGWPSHLASPQPSGTTHEQHRLRSEPDDPVAGLVFCRPNGRPLGPHHALDRLRQLSEEAGVPRITVHDLRHLAATISAGVPLTVASKTLRHSTLSATANIYGHLTRQAAREAVDIIDRTLTAAQNTGHETCRPTRPRPPRDHIHRLRETLGRLRSPTLAAFSTTAGQPQAGRATTLRPPWLRTHERPPSHG
ncbi:tyrosine-type recombinase/integrase [Streptomyces sp. CJ_13]|nr:tyrosine-type recombinase/integrase [Streptomyces sp. CJ_13]